MNDYLEYIKKINDETRNSRREVLVNQVYTNKPIKSFGKLESIGYKISQILGINKNQVRVSTCIFAGDHGISELGLSVFEQSQTKKIVELIGKGETPVNKICHEANSEIYCFDIGINADVNYSEKIINMKVKKGTRNFLCFDALERNEVINALNKGIEAANILCKKGVDIVAVGEVGIGNTISTSIITAILCGKNAEEVTDVGTGIDNEKLLKKRKIIEEMIDKCKSEEQDIITLLQKVGGLEICAEAGFIIGCSYHKIIVILDGYISGTAALVANEMCPNISNYIFGSHMSSEKGHKYIFDKLKLNSIFDMGMHYGLATGSSSALPMYKMAYKIVNK